jgi:hypothetical protein
MPHRDAPESPRPIIGEFVDGIEAPVVNERAVRAAAGLFVLLGAVGLSIAVFTGDVRLLRIFGIAFMLEMNIRLFAGTRFAPGLLLGGAIVRRQRPEWVGASQKKLAWSLGLVLSLISCGAMGWLGLPMVALAMCGGCLFVLFLEAAFGICLGCELQRRFGRTQPQLCPGDSCVYVPPKRSQGHSVLRDGAAHGTEARSEP